MASCTSPDKLISPGLKVEYDKIKIPEDKYDPDRFPPNIKMAKDHGKAKRIAICQKLDTDSPTVDVCDCCGLPIENDQLPLCTSRTELTFLGPGFPLYFEFLFFCIIMLAIMIGVSGIYNMASNYAQSDCGTEDDICTLSKENLLSLGNKSKHHNLYKIQAWINFACACVIMISMHLFRRSQRLTSLECDRGLLSPSDFSIMISHLPQESYSEKDIQKTLDDFMNRWPKSHEEEKNNSSPIAKIVLSYNIGEYIELIRLKNKYLNEKRRAFDYQNKTGKVLEHYNEKTNNENIIKTNIKIDLIEKETENGLSKKTCGVVFVTFKTEHEKKEFLDRCSFTFLQKIYLKFKMFLFNKEIPNNVLAYKTKILEVENAPEPNDVLWENLHYTDFYKLKIRFILNMISIIILIFCFGFILLISYLQYYVTKEAKKSNKSESKETGVFILGLLASFIIVFINNCLTITLKKFGHKEKHSTITHLYVANAIKLSIAQFINTAIILLVVNYILQDNLFQQGGIVTDLISVFATNIIVPPLMHFFNPWYLLRILKRRKIEKEGEKCTITQAEAHNAYEGGDIDMASRYAGLIKTLWLTAFYLSVTPIGALISFFGMIIHYFNDKYLVLRRYARPPLFSQDLNNEMIELLEYVPLFMGLGSIIFHFYLFDPTNSEIIPDLLTICLSSINFIFPSADINRKIFKIDEEACETDPYEKAKLNFPTDYDRANPVTQEAAMKEWVDLVEKSNMQDKSKRIEMGLMGKAIEIYNLNEDQQGKKKNIMNLNFYANKDEKFNNVIAMQNPNKMLKVLNTGQKTIEMTANPNYNQNIPISNNINPDISNNPIFVNNPNNYIQNQNPLPVPEQLPFLYPGQNPNISYNSNPEGYNYNPYNVPIYYNGNQNNYPSNPNYQQPNVNPYGYQ